MPQTERHNAVVANNQDPDNRGRIQVRCAGLLGSEDAIYQRWAVPCFDWGFFVIPDVGEQVEIEVVASSDRDEIRGQAFLEEPDLRYRGKRFYGPDTPVSAFFTEANYGKRRGFATPGGHVLMFDDTDGARKINLAWHSGSNTFSMVSIDDKGSVILSTPTGTLLYLNADTGEIALVDKFGNSYSSNADGIKIIDLNSNIISLIGTVIQVLSQSSISLSCKDVVLDAGKVQLGGISGPSPQSLLFGTSFVLHLNAFLTQLATFCGTITPTPSGLAAFLIAITNFQTLLATDVSTTSFTK